MTRLMLALVIAAMIAAGCVEPIAKLGCCLKENISQGCVLYNTTSLTEVDLISSTSSCDDPLQNTSGHCNVSIGGKWHLIPICSQDVKVPCIDPNCTAMVCGDFAYKPRVAPSISSTEDAADEAAPTNLEDEEAARFYKARCMFLPMDADLRQIMKASKSSINVFRVGVGESFDAYDQYRYFFPMSDQYCSVSYNPQGQAMVDRYMNYIDPTSLEAYYPLDEEDGITDNCFDDDDVYPPFTFDDTPVASSSGEHGTALGFAVVPDTNNYRFAHYMTYTCDAVFDEGFLGGNYAYDHNCGWNIRSTHKEIDEDFYKKELAIAHADVIYGLGATGTTRAAFECRIGEGDCLSGSCDTSEYNRGSLLKYDEALPMNLWDEVVADCVKMNDENNNERVICAPTKSASSPSGGNPPLRDYAPVNAKLSHIEVTASRYTDYYKSSKLAEEGGHDNFLWYWQNWEGKLRSLSWNSNSLSKTMSKEYDFVNMPYTMGFYWTKKGYCPSEYGEIDPDDEKYDETAPCSYAYSLEPSGSSMGIGPHAGGMVFFGKLGTEVAEYQGKNVIGYALVDADEFDETMLAQKCDLDYGITNDYVEVELGAPAYWSSNELMDTFEPYLEQIIDSYVASGFKDGCGEQILAYDSIIGAMPWVLAYEKGAITDFFGSRTYTDLVYPPFMASTPAYATRYRNIYDEPMWNNPDTGSCELRRNNDIPSGPFFSPEPMYYNILYGKKLILFLYDGESGAFGDCAIDKTTWMPTVREYGWCEPCTSSTLAFQEVMARDTVYLPMYTANVQEDTYVAEDICETNRYWNSSSWSYEDNVSCFHPRITDMDEYQGQIGNIGSPRTIPEASVLKQRLGDYMKSGVMPVIDLSDDSNWDLHNVDADDEGFWLFYDPDPSNFSQYDFERLFGNMGALVVIVDEVNEANAIDKIDQVLERASTMKSKCLGCIVAVNVKDPPSNQSFKNTINTVMAGTTAQFAIDMITFNYEVSDHQGVSAQGAEAVALDLASYGQVALQNKHVPTMVVGFNVRGDDPYWNDGNYDELFEEIMLNQDKLVNSGVVGIIYSPTRTPAAEEGIVDATDSGLWPFVISTHGEKTPKFCALQGALERMSSTIPTSMFSRITAVENVSCVSCSSFDLIPGGSCDPTIYPPLPGTVACIVTPGCDASWSEFYGLHTPTGCPAYCSGTDTSASCAIPVDYPDGCDPPVCVAGGCSIAPGCGALTDCTVTEAEAEASRERPWHACDDGTLCKMPLVGDPNDYKCPDNTVTVDCPICNETSGSYQCTYSYANGSSAITPKPPLPPAPLSQLDSDIWMDIIAGLPKPEKCCLYDSKSDTRYTFIKQTFNTPVNKPVVFPKAGGNADCGLGVTPEELGETSTFCNTQPSPISAFDIECTVS